MIPDKLYVEISGNKDSSVYWIGRTSSVPQSEDSVEYIRKDALLEKLNRARELRIKAGAKEQSEGIRVIDALTDLINKL